MRQKCPKCKNSKTYARFRVRREPPELRYVMACPCGNEWRTPFAEWQAAVEENDALLKARNREYEEEIISRPWSKYNE